ncbi:metallophosphoesterase [Kitasatospora sp. NPDC058965]|uniref:metallophosphoesterase n=1 Tax=Kitasatospora sp. NPDC058965 TaxID=3346682 RepID=UPI0036B7ECDF
MRYALFADVHGDTAALAAVLRAAARCRPDAVLGLGDLLECKVSKRDTGFVLRHPDQVVDVDPDLLRLLGPVRLLRGNQEERISALVPAERLPPGLRPLLTAPQWHRSAAAWYCHGHQLPWSQPEPGRFVPLAAEFGPPLLVHGHHHRDSLLRLPERCRHWECTEVVPIEHGRPVRLDPDRRYLVNLGPARGPEPSWVELDERAGTVVHHRTTKERPC